MESAEISKGVMAADHASDLRVRIADASDYRELWDLYADVCEAMRGTADDCLWELGVHPSHGDLEKAIAEGNLIVVEGAPCTTSARPGSRAILGAFVLNDVQAPGYECASWLVDALPSEVAVIHLLASSSAARGRGVGRAMLSAAVDIARSRGKRTVRLDVFPNNAPALRLYRSFGFTDVCLQDLTLADGSIHELVLMEYALEGARG